MTIVLGLSLYTWVMIAFLVILLIVLVLGDIGDLGFDTDVGTDIDTGLSPLSLPVIAVFGTAFGGFGTLFEMMDFGPFVTPVLAIVGAMLVAGGMWVVMMNVFVKTQAETKVELKDLVGTKGQVMVPIRPGQTGQILVITEARGRTLVDAIADDSINTDEHVVVDSIAGNAVKVHRA